MEKSFIWYLYNSKKFFGLEAKDKQSKSFFIGIGEDKDIAKEDRRGCSLSIAIKGQLISFKYTRKFANVNCYSQQLYLSNKS